ncbi:MAG TPA: molybdate ABC transporter substrate-binding protein [Nitrospira sp.]|nr:molybdate ABC transporter substrate-binding protein [Nitrospira sp.]
MNFLVGCNVVWTFLLTGWLLLQGIAALATEPLVVAASPSLAVPLSALAHAFEAQHPGVKVLLHYASGLELRQLIAGMQNRHGNKHFIGSGPIHIVAPGGDELITRLGTKAYVLPESRTPYATASLVLVVPESLVEAPTSFEALAKDSRSRIAVADPTLTILGQKTAALLRAFGGEETWKERLEVAADAKAVLDHVMNGEANAAIIYGPDAVREASRVRVAALAPAHLDRPVTYSMAMERFCPNRALCEKFLAFVRSPEAEGILKALGYGIPSGDAGSIRGLVR